MSVSRRAFSSFTLVPFGGPLADPRCLSLWCTLYLFKQRTWSAPLFAQYVPLRCSLWHFQPRFTFALPPFRESSEMTGPLARVVSDHICSFRRFPQLREVFLLDLRRYSLHQPMPVIFGCWNTQIQATTIRERGHIVHSTLAISVHQTQCQRHVIHVVVVTQLRQCYSLNSSLFFHLARRTRKYQLYIPLGQPSPNFCKFGQSEATLSHLSPSPVHPP